MAQFGKDEVVINNSTVVACDIDSQPGIFSIVGVPNSMMAVGPFALNFAILNRTVQFTPLVENRIKRDTETNFLFSNRGLQSSRKWNSTLLQLLHFGLSQKEKKRRSCDVFCLLYALENV